MIKIVWKCINIIAISPKRGMEQAEIMDTFWTYHLSTNSFLNISVFIVMCEAFLRVQPHFGLWLKVFNVKPKVVDGQHAECGGAMVSKLPNVSWPKGTFVETVKEWQRQWFYITEPRCTTWVAAAEFRSGAPMRLTSWVEKS